MKTFKVEKFGVVHEVFNPQIWAPPGWMLLEQGDDGAAYRDEAGRLTVIASGQVIDGVAWLHVSLSRLDVIPSYNDLARVKRAFIGDAREAYQVFPKAENHVSLHPRCLHLWSPEEPVLPDFTRGTGRI